MRITNTPQRERLFAWFDRTDPPRAEQMTPYKHTLAAAIADYTEEIGEDGGTLCQRVERNGREHLRAVNLFRINVAAHTPRGKWVLEQAGAPYGPSDSIPWKPLSDRLGEGAALYLLNEAVCTMRRRCGIRSWDNHYRVTLRRADGVTVCRDGFPAERTGEEGGAL